MIKTTESLSDDVIIDFIVTPKKDRKVVYHCFEGRHSSIFLRVAILVCFVPGLNRYNRLQKIESMLTGGDWSESVASPTGVPPSRGQSTVSREF